MIRHALARVLHAVADRIEPEAKVQYVYVTYTSPPSVPWQQQYTATGTTTNSN